MIAPRRSGPTLAVQGAAPSQACLAAAFPTPPKDTLNAPLKPLGIPAT